MILSGHKRNCNIKKNNCTVYCTIAKNYFCVEAKIAVAVHAVLQLVNPVQYRRRTHKLLYITEEELHTAQYRVKHNTVHFSTVRYNKDEKLYSVQYSKVKYGTNTVQYIVGGVAATILQHICCQTFGRNPFSTAD